MRKVSRGPSTGRRSGTARTDRSTKPGFRPKGNNAGSPRPSRKREDEGESRGGYSRGKGDVRPRISSGRDRADGPRTRYAGGDRPERSSRTAGGRAYGDDKKFRAPGSRSSYSSGSGADERPSRRPSFSNERGSDERTARRTYTKRTDSDERPSRSRSFSDDNSREERPARHTYTKRADSDERPSRSRSFSDDNSREERPARRTYTKRADSDERPSRSRSFSDDNSREERSARRTYTKRADSDERPSRSRSFSEDNTREEHPARRTYTKRADSDERPSRSRSFSEDNSSEERPSRRTYTKRADSDERPARSRSFSDDNSREERPARRTSRGSESGERPFRSREGGSERRSFGDKRRSATGRFAGKGDRRPQTFRAKKTTIADDGQTRLNKYISNCGICSRREADDLIKAGVISVNGNIITEMGFKVNPGDEVRYNNEILRGEKPVYLLLNKPKDYITTVDDPGQRQTVMELVNGACKERIYPVGRLDRNTTGVLLFTNDGDLARKLMHPSFNVQKVYHVSLSKTLKPEEMEKIMNGIQLEDGPIKADDIAYAGDGTDRKEVGIELHSGRNRIVRRIFESFGHEVIKLDRTVFAGLTKKDLTRGRYRFLSPMEVANLKMMVGEKRYREAMHNEQ